MESFENQYEGGQDFFTDLSIRLRDMEEKQHILKDRVLIMGKNLVDEREKTFMEIQEMKREILLLKEENAKLKNIIQNLTEQINKSARKEELMIMQRQLDLLRN